MAVSVYGIPEPVFQAYKRLKGWSRNGRYELRQFTVEFVETQAFRNLDIVLTFAETAAP